MLDSERGMVQYQFKKTLAQRLRDVDVGVSNDLEDLRKRLNNDLNFTEINEEVIGSFIDNHPFVQELIILDNNRNILFPTGGISKEEEKFIDVFVQLARERETSGEISEDLVSYQGSINKLTRFTDPDGWSVWFHDIGLSLIYWTHDKDNRLFISRLDRKAFLSFITFKLPNYAEEYPDERLSLANELGKEIYSWGGLSPETIVGIPQATMQLSFPLGSFQLRYYTTTFPGLKRNLQFQLFIQLGAVAFILLFLGLYISDAMRQAGKKLTFVNQVSHELKTPLTNIRMYAELLQNSIPEEDQGVKKKLEIIQTESQRLSRLINNVLAFSHDSVVKVKPEPNNIDELIKKVVDTMRPGLQQAGINIRLDLQAGLFVFDMDTMEQVLVNLISNVEKYAFQGKLLIIKSWKEKDRLYIRISDRGPGIPSKLKEQIFKPFFRIHDSITEGVSGAGIGLSLARDLVQKNGGELKLVEQEQGACFEVIL
jgi:signal transduction histidine kinase